MNLIWSHDDFHSFNLHLDDPGDSRRPYYIIQVARNSFFY